MPPETKIFLLITPPQKPLDPIQASCTIVGKTQRMFGIGTEFSSIQELETGLATAGLPDFEIERALQRLEMNDPTFSEISHAAAQSLGLVRAGSEVTNSVDQEMFETRRLLSSSFGVSVNRATQLV